MDEQEMARSLLRRIHEDPTGGDTHDRNMIAAALRSAQDALANQDYCRDVSHRWIYPWCDTCGKKCQSIEPAAQPSAEKKKDGR